MGHQSDKRMVHRSSCRWADIRRGAQVVRTEGVTLIVHRDGAVTICKEQENRSPPATVNISNLGANVTTQMRKPSQAEAASEARNKLPEKAANERRLQRQKQRDQERLREHLEAQACGARWLPLVQCLVRRNRAKSRCDVWTEHQRHKLMLREKWRGLVGHACAHDVRDRAILVRRAKATVRLHRLFAAYKAQHDVKARDAILRGYMRIDKLRDLLHGYRIVRNCEAAEDGLAAEPTSSCLELSPPGRRLSSCRHMHESPDDRGAQRADNRPGTTKSGAKKTRGGRSRRR